MLNTFTLYSLILFHILFTSLTFQTSDRVSLSANDILAFRNSLPGESFDFTNYVDITLSTSQIDDAVFVSDTDLIVISHDGCVYSCNIENGTNHLITNNLVEYFSSDTYYNLLSLMAINENQILVYSKEPGVIVSIQNNGDIEWINTYDSISNIIIKDDYIHTLINTFENGVQYAQISFDGLEVINHPLQIDNQSQLLEYESGFIIVGWNDGPWYLSRNACSANIFLSDWNTKWTTILSRPLIINPKYGIAGGGQGFSQLVLLAQGCEQPKIVPLVDHIPYMLDTGNSNIPISLAESQNIVYMLYQDRILTYDLIMNTLSNLDLPQNDIGYLHYVITCSSGDDLLIIGDYGIAFGKTDFEYIITEDRLNMHSIQFNINNNYLAIGTTNGNIIIFM